MIKLQVIGHLGKDAIVKEVNGKNVINFSVAHTEKWKDAQGNEKSRSTWVEVAYWTERTAIAPYLLKGGQVFVEGIPEADAYTNKDNQPTATLRLRALNIQLLGSATGAPAATAQAAQAAKPAAQSTVSPDAVDDLPF